SEIGRQRPGSRGPDGDARVCQRVRRTRSTHDRKFYVNGGVVAVLIFYFGLGEGGLRARAPENRFLRLVHKAFLNENRESAQNLRFVFGIHCQVRIFPIAEDAESSELLALDVDEFSRKRFAFLSDLNRSKLARFLYHFVLDWQAMAVPTR